jgi:anti-anti-sigma factor
MKGNTKLRVDTRDSRVAVAHISGRLDLGGTGGIELALAEIVAAHTHVVVDLSRVDYISSVGLRLLILAERTSTKRGRFDIINPQPHVAQILLASGIGRVIRMVPAGSASKNTRGSLRRGADDGAVRRLRLVPQPSRGLKS